MKNYLRKKANKKLAADALILANAVIAADFGYKLLPSEIELAKKIRYDG